MRVLSIAAVATLLAVPAAAQSLPPANQLVRVFTEVEWDDDGYWDIEFTNNRRSSARLDPFSGAPRSRRR